MHNTKELDVIVVAQQKKKGKINTLPTTNGFLFAIGHDNRIDHEYTVISPC